MLSRLVVSHSCQRSLALSPKYAVGIKEAANASGVKTAQQATDDWLATAGKMGRPMSPHLSIYKWSIPMTMSAVNRIFAFGLVFGFIAIPFVDFFTGDIVAAINELSVTARATTLGAAALFVGKCGIFWPFFYHTFVGFRHWSWDIFAVGIRDMGVLYQTGYIAIALSLVLGVAFALYHKEN